MPEGAGRVLGPEHPLAAKVPPLPHAAVARSAFWLLEKFHRETACGRDGLHWAECERLVDAVGWESWEEWRTHYHDNA